MCSLWPIYAHFDGYFDVLAVQSISFVLLSCALDWSQRRRDVMDGHMIALHARLTALPHLVRGRCEGLARRKDAAIHRRHGHAGCLCRDMAS